MAQPPDILKLARDFRAQLVAGESASAARMVYDYTAAYEKLLPELESVLREIERDGITVGRLFAKNRIEKVLAQIGSEIGRFAGQADALISERRRLTAQLAVAHARALGEVSLPIAPTGLRGPTWTTLPTDTIENLTGFLAPQTPLTELLGELVPHAVARVRDAMILGATTGMTAPQIVAKVRESLGSNQARFLAIHRTAEMQAYREATQASFEANADVLAGWRWLASLSFDTCAACLAKHGTLHPVSERMDSHWNCRCVAVPETKSYADLGYPGLKDVRPEWENGEEWLSRQSEENQKRTLGPSKFAAWKAGRVKLVDFVGHTDDPVWGAMSSEIGLNAAIQAAAGRDSALVAPHIPIQDALTKQHWGGPSNVTLRNPDLLKQFSEDNFGRAFSGQDWADLVAAPTGSDVVVVPSLFNRNQVEIKTTHPDLIKRMDRTLSRDANGLLKVHNDYFIGKAGAFKGFGVRAFGLQVNAMAKAGVRYMDTYAAGHYGHPTFNGYYTWPRFGYNAPLSRSYITLLPANLRSARNLHELFSLPGGPEWWKEHGQSIDVEFDLSEGSAHRKALELYMKKNKVKV